MASQEKVMSRMAEYRRRAGITQEDAAVAVNVTRQTIIAIEKGNYVPSVLLAMKIAKLFNAKVEELFYYED